MGRVVIFGVDGVRLDSLQQAATPSIDRISREGWLRPVEVSPQAPTLSGPCWATIATGVAPDLHGIYGNMLNGQSLSMYPDVLSQIRDRGGRTYLAVTWSPLATTTAGGPIFGPPTRLSVIDAGGPGHHEDDAAIAADAAAALQSGEYDAAFVYLGTPDSVAHEHGTGPKYLEAIEHTDRQVGRVLDGIERRPSYSDEQWTVVVVTDHGHRDEGGHGGRSEAERTAWIAACGPGADAHGEPAGHEDVAKIVFAATPTIS